MIILIDDNRDERVIVLAALEKVRGGNVEASHRLGANSYVCKPVGFRKMAGLMRSVVAYWTRIDQSVH
jgi:hypothetical protein